MGSKLGAFLRRHKRAEKDVAIGVGLSLGWRAIGGLLGAGVAAAAIAVPTMIDLSNNNGPGAAVAIASVGAVEAKATEGLTFRDADYPTFRAAAAKAHRPFGGYLFLHPYLDGKAQADYFLAYAHPRPGDLQPVVDSETGSPYAAAASTLAALNELKAKGYRPLLYASSYYVNGLVAARPAIKAYRIWDAEYGPVLHRWPGLTYAAWQYTDRALVAGHALDGSRLLVPVASLRIPLPPAPRHAPRPARHPSKSPAVLRAERGYWSWLAWYLGEGDWKHHARQAKAVRPHVPARVPAAWWRAERAFLHARSR